MMTIFFSTFVTNVSAVNGDFSEKCPFLSQSEDNQLPVGSAYNSPLIYINQTISEYCDERMEFKAAKMTEELREYIALEKIKSQIVYKNGAMYTEVMKLTSDGYNYIETVKLTDAAYFKNYFFPLRRMRDLEESSELVITYRHIAIIDSYAVDRVIFNN